MKKQFYTFAQAERELNDYGYKKKSGRPIKEVVFSNGGNELTVVRNGCFNYSIV